MNEVETQDLVVHVSWKRAEGAFFVLVLVLKSMATAPPPVVLRSLPSSDFETTPSPLKVEGKGTGNVFALAFLPIRFIPFCFLCGSAPLR
jgi:hypothetical protein